MDILQALHPRYLSGRQRVIWILLFLGVLGGGQLGAHFFTAPAVISPVPGLALAGLMLGGMVLWPAIFLGTVVSTFMFGGTLITLFLLPLAHSLQALAGVFILQKLDFDAKFSRLRDMFTLMGVSLIISAIVPTIGFLARYLNSLSGNSPAAMLSWGSWWTGCILSLLVVGSLFIAWSVRPRLAHTYKEGLEVAGIFGVLILILWVLSFTTFTSLGGVSLVYVLLAPLFWIAIRLGPRFTILALFLISVMFFAATFYGPHAPAAAELGARLFQLEIFLIIIAIIFYIITALQEERRVAIGELTSYINKLENALNQLSLQDRAKSDFVAILAHELRNPLAPIVSSLELLRLNLPASARDLPALDLMENHLKTIQRLLDDLLDVSRISKSKLILRKESVDLRSIIERSVQSIEKHIKTRGQTLILDIDREPVVLEADPVRIEQVVNNLLSNASKFTNEGGRIYLSAKREGEEGVIRVSDNGIGMDPQMLKRIFEPFTQLDNESRTSEGGLGIGLSLTQKLVEMHDGTVEAYSEGRNKGSEFMVRLPLLPAFSSVPLPEKKGHVLSPLSAPSDMRILVVDDNAAAAQGIGALLQHKGYTVAYAYTGKEAGDKLDVFKPDAVVLDIGLPDMDGYSVAKYMRGQGGFGGTLVALTGYGQDEDKERARDAGFNHHLTKPISIVDLETILVQSV
ncbi:response regulator [Acetobacteraceae bacterium]|nr:response regulator [Candidatus Parcubacteria bacterium]